MIQIDKKHIQWNLMVHRTETLLETSLSLFWDWLLLPYSLLENWTDTGVILSDLMDYMD